MRITTIYFRFTKKRFVGFSQVKTIFILYTIYLLSIFYSKLYFYNFIYIPHFLIQFTSSKKLNSFRLIITSGTKRTLLYSSLWSFSVRSVDPVHTYVCMQFIDKHRPRLAFSTINCFRTTTYYRSTLLNSVTTCCLTHVRTHMHMYTYKYVILNYYI